MVATPFLLSVYSSRVEVNGYFSAFTLFYPLYSFFITLGYGILSVTSILNDKNNRYLFASIIISVLLFLIFALLLCNSYILFNLIEGNRELSFIIYNISIPISLNILPTLLSISIIEVLLSRKEYKIPIYYNIVYLILNLIGGFIFIEMLRLKSSAFYFVPLSGYLALAFLFIISYSHRIIELDDLIPISSSFKKIFKVFKTGISVGLVYSSESLFFLSLSIIMYGSMYYIGAQVSLQYLSILIVLHFSVGQALSIHISKLDNKSKSNISILYKKSLLILISISLPIVFLGNVYYSDIFKLVYRNSYNYSLFKVTLVMISLFYITEYFRLMKTHVLKGLEVTSSPLIYSIVCFWVICLLLGYFMSFFIGDISYIVSLIISNIINIFLLDRNIKYYFSKSIA